MLNRIVRAKILSILVAAAGLSPMGAMASTIVQATGSDSTYVNSTIAGTESGQISLASELAALGSNYNYAAQSGTLVLAFAEDATASTASVPVTFQTTAGRYNYINTVTQDTVTVSTPESGATIALAGESESGAAGGYSVTYTTSDTGLQYQYQYAGYLYYTETQTYTTTSSYSGDFTVDVTLSGADLAQLTSGQTLDYTLSGTNTPKLLSDSLTVDFAQSSSLPAPHSLGLLGLAFAAVGLGRRRKVLA